MSDELTLSSQDSATNWLPSPERLDALAEFAAGAGHEIDNPLATIIGRAQQLLRNSPIRSTGNPSRSSPRRRIACGI